MKFSDLTLKDDFIIHKVGEFEFKEKSFLNFDEEVEVVVSVINAATSKTIIENVVNDKQIITKYLLLFYTLIATDIEFTEDEISDPKNVIEVLVSNKIDKIFNESYNYNYLYNWIISLLEEDQKRKNSFNGLISEIIEKLPTALESLESNLQEFDKENMKKFIGDLAA